MRFALLVLLSLAPACAHVQSSAPSLLVCPARGGPTWHQLDSAHFQLRTDLPLNEARRMVFAAERSWERIAIAMPLFLPDRAEPGMTDLIIFAHADDLQRLRPNAAVQSFPTDDNDRPAIVTRHEDATVPSLHFALAQRFLKRRVPRPPLWIMLGLAQFLRPASSRQGMLEIGGGLTMNAWSSPDAIEHALEAVLAADVNGMDGDARPIYDQVSLLVVHWLADGSVGQQERLRKIIVDATRGVGSRAAFVERIGEPHAIAQALAAHALAMADNTGLYTLRYPLPADGDYEIKGEHEIDEAQLHYLWAGMGDSSGQLEDAVAHANQSPLVHWWLATRTEAHGDQVGAEAELTRAIALAPSEPRWRRERAIMHIRRATSGRDTAAMRAVAPEVESLADGVEDARTLNVIAWYYAKRGDVARGLPLARRAIALRPESSNTLDTLALLLMEAGQVVEARAAEEEAFARLPIGARVSDDMRELLVRLREGSAGRAVTTVQRVTAPSVGRAAEE